MLPTLQQFDSNLVKVSPDKTTGNIKIYYTGKTRLHIKTSVWSCPYGRNEQTLIVVVPDSEYFLLERFDELGRNICRMYTKDAESEDDDLPYKSLIMKDNDLDAIKLVLNSDTRFFDRNGVLLNNEQVNQVTAGKFEANFLLLFTLNNYKGTYFWSLSPVQVKIKEFCTLPEGCVIFTDEQELMNELSTRTQTQIEIRHEQEAPVVDFDPDLNELL